MRLEKEVLKSGLLSRPVAVHLRFKSLYISLLQQKNRNDQVPRSLRNEKDDG